MTVRDMYREFQGRWPRREKLGAEAQIVLGLFLFQLNVISARANLDPEVHESIDDVPIAEMEAVSLRRKMDALEQFIPRQ